MRDSQRNVLTQGLRLDTVKGPWALSWGPWQDPSATGILRKCALLEVTSLRTPTESEEQGSPESGSPELLEAARVREASAALGYSTEQWGQGRRRVSVALKCHFTMFDSLSSPTEISQSLVCADSKWKSTDTLSPASPSRHLAPMQPNFPAGGRLWSPTGNTGLAKLTDSCGASKSESSSVSVTGLHFS